MTASGIVPSPVGSLLATLSGDGLRELRFPGAGPWPALPLLTGPVADKLQAYFAGDLRAFSIPVDLSGVTDFTRRVLEATATIPYGETVGYGEIARMIGMPGATQAVGNALGANPVPIVIPCHRVIRSDGSLGWFTGGPEIKRALLRLEGVEFAEQASLPL